MQYRPSLTGGGDKSSGERHWLAGTKPVEAGLVAVSGEALRESAHRVLIRAYLKEGNRGEAIRQYEACRQVLRRELGIDPSPVTEALLSSPVARTLQAVTVRRRCGGVARGG